MEKSTPYDRDPGHRSAFELAKLIIFEPDRIDNLSNAPSKDDYLNLFVSIFIWASLFIFVIISSFTFIQIFDRPEWYLFIFWEDLALKLQGLGSNTKYLLVLNYAVNFFIFSLFFGLFFGLFANWSFFLSGVLALGFAGILAFGFAGVLTVYSLEVSKLYMFPYIYIGYFGVLSFTFALGLSLLYVEDIRMGSGLGLGLGLGRGLVFGLVLGLIFSLAFGLVFGLVLGLIFGLTTSLSFYCGYFRLIFYPIYFCSALSKTDLSNNMYLNDALIWLPIPSMDKKIVSYAWKDPERAFQFVAFLEEHRPFQRHLAYHLVHTATAALWFYNPLKLKQMFPPPIDFGDKRAKHFIVSDSWLNQIEVVKANLAAAKQQNHTRLKKEMWSNFHHSLKIFEDINLQAREHFKGYYSKAIRRWKEESRKELNQIDIQLQTIESISANFYRKGEALSPKAAGYQPFFGREDVKNELAIRILSSATMPTFLLQGQRRVGKTSLLNFLPLLLGSGFLVIIQDMQSDEFLCIADCFNGFIEKLKRELGMKESQETNGSPGWIKTDAMAAWKKFKKFIHLASKSSQRKLILAFDEYENLHRLVKKEGDKGVRIIEAMRAFSQEQNTVVFLFAGLYLFSDLGEPDFGRYFIHAHRLKIDYLNSQSAHQLITEPYPDFKLSYTKNVVSEMIRITAGHPALLQHICFEMVNRANVESRNRMDQKDLDIVLNTVLDRSNEIMNRFWLDFCDDAMRSSVLDIMASGSTENQKHIARLLDYAFILRNDKGALSLRVPVFERWIRYHGISI